MTARMQPLTSADQRQFANLRGVFTDIDDTLTTHGRIHATAYTALENLRASGLRVIPITGRPAGWCDLIARTWPVDAVVGENGAFYFRYDDTAKTMQRGYTDAAATRAQNRQRLDQLAAKILAEVPGSAISVDQPYREADLAIDFCEDVPPLTPDAIDRIATLFRAAGATAKISSIHVNGWFGTYDKLTMTKRMMRDAFDVDLDADRGHYAFVGDSPNDAPMFGYFPLSIGVANVTALAAKCEALPAFVTTAPYGAGFAEVANVILSARNEKPRLDSATPSSSLATCEHCVHI
jgi:HAD superfamily hydrolase (TIGR01484 family)